MRRCISCGRIIKEDISDTAGSGKNEELKYCSECLDESGKLKTYDQVAESLTKYLIRTQGLDEKAATNAAKAIASSQPEWDKKQGVYFEKDMKKKRRLVVTLFVVLALILSGTGIGIWISRSCNQLIYLFQNKESYETTRIVNDITIHELEIPGRQKSLGYLLSDDPNIIIFHSPIINKLGHSKKWSNIYSYNLKNSSGEYLMGGYDRSNIPWNIYDTAVYPKNGMCLIPKSKEDILNDDYRSSAYAYRFTSSYFYPDSETYKKTSIGTGNYSAFYNNSNFTSANWSLSGNNEILDPVIIDGYIVWKEYATCQDMASESAKLILYNPYTNRDILITDTLYANPRNNYSVTENYITWMDNRNINLQTPVLYCYDIQENDKYVVSEVPGTELAGSNDRYIIVTQKDKSEGYNTNTGLSIFDTQDRSFLSLPMTREIIYQYHDYAIYEMYRENNFKLVRESVIDSKENIEVSDGTTPEDTYISWIEEIKDTDLLPSELSSETSLKFSPRLIGIQNIANIGEKPLRVVATEDITTSQCPIKITSEYIVWWSANESNDSKKLWIGRIADGVNDGVVESILIDEYTTKSSDTYTSINLSDEYVCWEKHTSNDANICWAKISDIFPEKNNVTGMEE